MHQTKDQVTLTSPWVTSGALER